MNEISRDLVIAFAVPICATIAMFAVMRSQVRDLRLAVRELTNELRTEAKELQAAIKDMSHRRVHELEGSVRDLMAWRTTYSDHMHDSVAEVRRRLDDLEEPTSRSQR